MELKEVLTQHFFLLSHKEHSPIPNFDEVPAEQQFGFCDEVLCAALGQQQLASLVQEGGVQQLGLLVWKRKSSQACIARGERGLHH